MATPHAPRLRTGCLLLAAVGGAVSPGCDELGLHDETQEPAFDGLPIRLDRSSGALTTTVQEQEGSPMAAVLDLLSPITVFDFGPDTDARRRSTSFWFYGLRAGGGELPRAELKASVIDLHPCAEVTCLVGRLAAPIPVAAVVGADSFGSTSIRANFAESAIRILPGIAGAGNVRSQTCDAIFPSAFGGGGTLTIDGAYVEFGATRAAIGACINPSDGRQPDGSNALFIASTGIGISILSQSAYTRWQQNGTTPPAPALGAVDGAHIVSGTIEGQRVTVDRLALVGTSLGNPRSPCQEVYAHRFLRATWWVNPDNCPDANQRCLCEQVDALEPGWACPCLQEETCAAPAMVDLAPAAPIQFIVVPDDNPTLQALRAELRPARAEVDGILGTDALAALEVDFDYPNDRLLLRCVGAAPECVAHRRMADLSERNDVECCESPMTTLFPGAHDDDPCTTTR